MIQDSSFKIQDSRFKFKTKTLKTPLLLSVAFGLRSALMSVLMKASFQRPLLSTALLRPATQPTPSEKHRSATLHWKTSLMTNGEMVFYVFPQRESVLRRSCY